MRKKLSYLLLAFLVAILISMAIFPKLRQNLRRFGASNTRGFAGFLLHLGHSLKMDFAFVAEIGHLKKENDELAQKLINLQVDRSQIKELQNENDLLKKELGFVGSEEQGSLVPAKIIQRDPTDFMDSVTIDRGANDGIAKGMAVIFSGALVGQIEDVSANASTVLLITSKDSLIQAQLQDSRAKGILKGGISGLYIEKIMSDTDYKTGENVITSGLGGGIREGILIGTAGKLESSQSGIFKTISVEPTVDLSKLELVFVEK